MAKQKRRGHGEGSIYQRSDGRWVAEITLEGGKRKSFYGKSRKEAADKLNRALQEQKQGKLATGPQQKLETYLNQWLEDVHKPTLRQSSYVKYRRLLDRHILPELGHIQVQRLTPQQVQAFYARKLHEGLSESVVSTMHRVLHNALDNAVKWNLVSRNVCDLVTPPHEKKRTVQLLTLQQAQHLLGVAQGHELEGLLTVAVTTGMRHGELAALRWSDIDFGSGSVHVHRTVNRLGGYGGFVESEPKTAKSNRTIVLPAFVLEKLKEHQIRQKESRLRAGAAWKDQDLVFCNRYGGFLNPDALLGRFYRLLEKAGLPRMRLHDLRHSAATILLGMGAHPKVVQELLGHSNISMTIDTYSHMLPSMQRETMSKLNDLFRNGHGNNDEAREDELGI
jgi:integrase